jgi:hypothetical protein
MKDKIVLQLGQDANKDVTISVASENEATLFHGSTGLFSDACIERDIVSALVNPFGILAEIEAFATVNENPVFGLLTGFNEDSEALEPETVCEDAPTGLWETCKITAEFGDLQRCMNTVEAGRIIMNACRGDTRDLRLRCRVIGDMGALQTPVDQTNMLNTVIRSEMVGVAKLFHRKLSRTIWTGTSSNNVGTGYKEPLGLLNWVTTGYTDTDGITLCPDVDSQVIDGDTEGSYAPLDCDLIRELFIAEMEWTIRGEACAPNFWKIFMHPYTWWELTKQWSCCLELTCETPSSESAMSQQIFFDANELRRERNQMLQNKFLFLNGNRYDVVLDTGIPLSKNSADPTIRGLEIADDNITLGSVSSPIVVLPITYDGGAPATYLEYLDWSQLPEQLAGLGSRVADLLWSDDGKYIWAIELVKWCLKACGRIVWRVLLLTPFLAAKFINYEWVPDKQFSYEYGD